MKRIAVVDRDLCTKECGIASAKACPVNRMGKPCITLEEGTGYPIIDENLCIGCGICVKKCQVGAITIINLKEEIGTPIYQFGVNKFRVHGLPLPKDGVTGLIGKNGIGKTTTLRILTKQLRPNFALGARRKLPDEEIMQRLPIEQARYWKSLGAGLKVSYKPQNVSQLQEMFDGTVAEIMDKFDATPSNDRAGLRGAGAEELKGSFGTCSTAPEGRKQEAMEKFGLGKIAERRMGQLSGGELQKVAIAIAYMKNADIYFFDEPTNYLDIAERLRMAIILQEFGKEKKVMLAEHDLAILDYASDYVYLFWGDENVYGVVSAVKNVRSGINEYLAGYLREENIKFRDKEITFSRFSEGEKKKPVKFHYSEMRKHYEGFDLSCDAGGIQEGEVIGIVGRNALGKSTFVKMLAGVEKPDEGEGGQFRVSYKPQYIKAEEGVAVEQLFSAKNLNADVLEECKRRLGLSRLVLKELTELSGGELQRVAIALALSTEADLYLLDEPSAFMDIEQRLNLADLLHSIFAVSEKSAFIVDHDIVFIDAVSSRLIVFDGEQSVNGHASAPMGKREGMNSFLKLVGISMRRDKNSNRPRINKPGSALDREQKEAGEYYYQK